MGKVFETVDGWQLSVIHNSIRDTLAATLESNTGYKVQTEVEILNGRIDVSLDTGNEKFAFEVKTGTKGNNIRKAHEQCVNYYEHGYYPVLVFTTNLLAKLDSVDIQIIKETIIDVGAEILIYDSKLLGEHAFIQLNDYIPLIEDIVCPSCGDTMVDFGSYHACIWCDGDTDSVPHISDEVISMLKWVNNHSDMPEFNAGFNTVKGPEYRIDREGMSGIAKARDRIYDSDT